MKAVIGLGFGDEGKGLTTDYLCSQVDNPFVIRFSGGSQAGHTVVHNGIKHVFSSFGSGSLRGAPTYWTKDCALDPIRAVNELDVLRDKGINPHLYINRHCPIITPFDKEKNRYSEAVEHGTCGIGFGATIERQENHYSLTFKDIYYPNILRRKMELIRDIYYGITDHGFNPSDVSNFYQACEDIVNSKNILSDREYPIGDKDIILEGSQGLMLDQEFGFFPHVTRSHLGSENIISEGYATHYYLVTRAYQTRHGNGPMTNEHISHNIKENPEENNVTNKYQGEFRRTILDLDLLKYAIECDDYIRPSQKTLVVTCLDHVENEWKFTRKEDLINCKSEDEFIEEIKKYLKIENVIRFRSAETPAGEVVVTV